MILFLDHNPHYKESTRKEYMYIIPILELTEWELGNQIWNYITKLVKKLFFHLITPSLNLDLQSQLILYAIFQDYAYQRILINKNYFNTCLLGLYIVSWNWVDDIKLSSSLTMFSSKTLYLFLFFSCIVVRECKGVEIKGYNPPTHCLTTVDCPKYNVIHSEKEFEIRNYSEALWVTAPPVVQYSIMGGIGRAGDKYVISQSYCF